MNIVDFLIANYHWILAIILLTIITIIGFLADKKKNDKKNDVSTPKKEQNKMTIKQQPMQYQSEIENIVEEQQNMTQNKVNNVSMNENLNINRQDNILMNQMNDNQRVGTIPQPITFGGEIQKNTTTNLINNPQPVENIVSETIQEPIYQPLEEQKPHFAPQPIPNFETMKEVQSGSTQIINNQMSLENQNMMNQPPIMQVVPQNMNMGQEQKNSKLATQISNYNQNNNNYGITNTIPNQGTLPQPVNPIPVPTPIMPQPIMANQMQRPESMVQMPTHNITQQVPNQNVFIGNQNPPQPMVQANQQQMSTPMAPVNFIYGPQNNNQNM